MRLPTALGRERQLIGYSSANFGKHLLQSGADVTLLFLLTDLLRIPAASIGLIMLAVFVGDVVFGLLAGVIAGWAQRHGLTYRWLILTATIPCAAMFALLYALPLLGARHLLVVMAVLLVSRAAHAIVDVPHNSLLAKIAPGSRARGRTSGYRYFFSTLASIVIAILLLPAVATAAQRGTTGALALMGAAVGLVFCLSMLIAAWSARGEAVPKRSTGGRQPILPRIDAPFCCMAAIAVVNGFAMHMFGKLVLHMATYVLHQPSLAGQLLLTMTLAQLPGVMLWTSLVRRFDTAFLLGIGYAVAATGFVAFALSGTHVGLLLAASALTGIGLAGVFMLPWGLLANVVDFAEYRYGERREVATFSTYMVIGKASKVAAIALVGGALGTLGYVPGAPQTAEVNGAIQLLSFGVPVLGSVAAILVLTRLAVGHRAHARIRRVLMARHRRAEQPSAGAPVRIERLRDMSARGDVPRLRSGRTERLGLGVSEI